jgi:large subunit ribosomal protein L4
METQAKKRTVKKAAITTDEGSKKKTELKELEISVFDASGKEVKTIELAKEVFGVKASKELMAQYIRVYNANQRQGTVATKTRSEVAGTTKKVYRQKGTGNARHGSQKAPVFVGGGVTFGPQPRDFSLKMNKKQKRMALFAALSSQAQKQQVHALANEVMDIEPKTRTMADLLKKIGPEKGKILVVAPELKKSGMVLASRNLPNVELVQATTINPFMILTSKKILFVEDALKVVQTHFLKA